MFWLLLKDLLEQIYWSFSDSQLFICARGKEKTVFGSKVFWKIVLRFTRRCWNSFWYNFLKAHITEEKQTSTYKNVKFMHNLAGAPQNKLPWRSWNRDRSDIRGVAATQHCGCVWRLLSWQLLPSRSRTKPPIYTAGAPRRAARAREHPPCPLG